MIACKEILIIKTWTYTQMQRVIAFFLFRAFFKTRSLSSQSQLYHVLQLIIWSTFATYFNYSLHITSFCTYQTASNLKFLIIIYLYIEPASVFYVFILHLLSWLLWLWHRLEALLIVLLLLLSIYILIGKLCHLSLSILWKNTSLRNSRLLLLLICIRRLTRVENRLRWLLLSGYVFLIRL